MTLSEYIDVRVEAVDLKPLPSSFLSPARKGIELYLTPYFASVKIAEGKTIAEEYFFPPFKRVSNTPQKVIFQIPGSDYYLGFVEKRDDNTFSQKMDVVIMEPDPQRRFKVVACVGRVKYRERRYKS